MEKKRARVFIEGRVQGVFFRSSTKEEARLLGIKGWVRNCWDGRVEAVFEGEKGKVEKIVKWCHKGPPGSLVTNVNINWEQAIDEFDTFSIKY